MLAARKLVYQGDRAYAEGDLVPARNAYREGSRPGAKCSTPTRSTSPTATGEDLMDMIKRYRRILSQLDEPFPEPFILQDIIDQQQKQGGGGK